MGLELRVPQKLMLAAYPKGAHYRRHYDSYQGADIPRLVTVLLYLDWRPQRGGELRVLMPGDEPRVERTIEPKPGRLVVFFAQEVEHEVMMSEGERFALTLWIWDRKKDRYGR